MTDPFRAGAFISGGAVNAQSTPTSSVEVDVGAAYVDGNAFAWNTVGYLDILAGHPADPTYQRWDYVGFVGTNGVGSIFQVVGGQNVNLDAPFYRNALAAINVQPAASVISSDLIVDLRDQSGDTYDPLPAPANTLLYTFLSGAQANTDPGFGFCGFDANTNGTIAHLYLSLYSATLPVDIGGWASLGSSYYLKLSSQEDRAVWWIGEVTNVTVNSKYLDLAITFVRKSDHQVGAPGTLAPPLSTDPLDTVLEFMAFPPSTGVTSWDNAFDIVSSAAETDLLNVSVPGGTLSANSALLIAIEGDVLSNANNSDTILVKIKFGGTTLWASTATLGTTSTTHYAFFLNALLANENATNAQRLAGRCSIGPRTAATTGIGPFGTADQTSATFGGTSAVDTTSSQTLEITATLGHSSASFEFKGSAHVLVIP